jgi:hypothetical protein
MENGPNIAGLLQQRREARERAKVARERGLPVTAKTYDDLARCWNEVLLSYGYRIDE